MGVEGCRIGHRPPVKDDVPVGLVADQEDGVAVGGALLSQDSCHAGQRRGRIDHAGGVIGGVDEDGGDLRRQHLLKGVQVGLEGRSLGRHHLQLRAGARHIGAVLREIGGEGQHLVAGDGDGPQGVGDGARRAGGGENMLLLIGQAEPGPQMGGHRGAETGVALVGAVAVEGHRVLMGQQVLHGRRKGRRAGHAGVAQRVIKDVLIADLGSALLAVGGRFPDDALVAEHPAVHFVQHQFSPFLAWDAGGAAT